MNVVKTKWQYEAEARWLLTEIALEKAEAAVEGRRYRPSVKHDRAIKAVAASLGAADAREAAARRSKRGGPPRPPAPSSYRADVIR